MINKLPIVFEVLNGTAKKQSKEKSSVSNNSSSKHKSNSKSAKFPKGAQGPQPQAKDREGGLDDAEEEEKYGDALCGACGKNYASDEFWVCCDICEKWFPGKCVKITPARAEHIKQ